MRKLSSFTGYDICSKYTAGCTGQTVYVYDNGKNELARFKDLVYAYQCLFSPDEKTLAVRSNEGKTAIYSMENMSLICKFRYGKSGQDEGFCFSATGQKLYLIEQLTNNEHSYSRLISYPTSDYSKKIIEFENEAVQLLNAAPGNIDEEVIITGYMRGASGNQAINFIACMHEGIITDIKYTDSSPENNHRFGAGISPIDECTLHCKLNDIKQTMLELRELVCTPKQLKNQVYQTEKEAVLDQLLSQLQVFDSNISALGKETFFHDITKKNLPDNLKKIWQICNR